jgi:nucleoside-diphosphate-sugar epimerase
MNILITGISGFVGANLVNFFASLTNVTIFGLDIVNPDMGDVEEIFEWKGLNNIPDADAIIHLAGKAHDTTNQTDEDEYFDINLGLTKKIYDCFLKSKAKKFVFFSSVKAAADIVEGEFLSENVIPSPKGPYGESKIAAENYILGNLPKDKQVYILRPCMIHGPGNKGNLNLLYKIASKGIPWPLGSFDNERSFCSIDNISYVIEDLISKNIPSGIYQVADDKPLSTNVLIELIGKSVDNRASIWNINQGLIKSFAKIGDALHLPLNTERLRKLTESYVVSNEKLKKALGITEMPVTARDGMMKTLESFRRKD